MGREMSDASTVRRFRGRRAEDGGSPGNGASADGDQATPLTQSFGQTRTRHQSVHQTRYGSVTWLSLAGYLRVTSELPQESGLATHVAG